jgi:hypothetical protein
MGASLPYPPGVEVTGRGIAAALEAFGGFTVLAGQVLLANGVGRADRNGFILLDSEGWYPIEGYLKAYREIEAQFGEGMIRKLGAAKARHARFPTTIVDVPTAMRALDVAYHMNHRHRGHVMFDTKTGTLLEGIGHYFCYQVPGQSKIVMRCDNPYPCAFDEGLIEELARRFATRVTLAHDPSSTCRKKGATSCTYMLTW